MPALLRIIKNPVFGLQVVLVGVLFWPLGYYAWDTYRLFTDGPEVPLTGDELPRLESRPSGDAPKLTRKRVAGWKLFGEYQAPKGGPETPEMAEASEATELRLLGVFNTGRPLLSSAIIRHDDEKKHRRYYVGTRIDSGTRLRSVHPGHVILMTPRGPEKLTLGTFDNENVEVSEQSNPDTSDKEEGDTQELGKYSQGIANLAGLIPVEPGKAKGYRVTDNFIENRDKTFGLKKGDVIKTVNGYPVGIEENDRLAWRAFKTSETAQATVIRDNQQITVRYP